jgi:hypothetical protein
MPSSSGKGRRWPTYCWASTSAREARKVSSRMPTAASWPLRSGPTGRTIRSPGSWSTTRRSVVEGHHRDRLGTPAASRWADPGHGAPRPHHPRGAEAIKQIGGALPKLTEHGLLGPDETPLLRHLYEVVVLERPLHMPWSPSWRGAQVRAAVNGASTRVTVRTTAGGGTVVTAEHFTETAAILACAVSYWTA